MQTYKKYLRKPNINMQYSSPPPLIYNMRMHTKRPPSQTNRYVSKYPMHTYMYSHHVSYCFCRVNISS